MDSGSYQIDIYIIARCDDYRMISRSIALILIMILFSLGAGCTQQYAAPVPDAGQVSSSGAIPPVQGAGNDTPVSGPSNSPVPVQTAIIPDPEPVSPAVSPGVPNLSVKPDKNVEFRDRLLLALDNLQASKEGIITSYRAGEYARVTEKTRELSDLIRNKEIISDMPSKMDYARMNYFEYTDQAGQFAQSFSEGATRWLASDKSSANPFFEAGIMASDRADIAD